MPDTTKPARPVFLAVCQITVDLDGKKPAKTECQYDRERMANPELQKGMVCGPRFETFKKGHSQLYRFEMICRPELKSALKFFQFPLKAFRS